MATEKPSAVTSVEAALAGLARAQADKSQAWTDWHREYRKGLPTRAQVAADVQAAGDLPGFVVEEPAPVAVRQSYTATYGVFSVTGSTPAEATARLTHLLAGGK